MSRFDDIPWDTSVWLEATMRIPLFGQEANVRVIPEEDDSSLPCPSQARALEAFLMIGPERREALTQPIADNCQQICDITKEMGVDIGIHLDAPSDVWRHVRLQCVVVPKHGSASGRHVYVAFGCDWDEEHGLELAFKNEELVRVSEQQCWTEVDEESDGQSA